MIKSRTNQDAFDRLTSTLLDGQGIGFIGAGSSARIGYPTWSQLVALMVDKVRSVRPEDNVSWIHQQPDPLWQAEELRELMGEAEFQALMRIIFREKTPPCDQFHRTLVTLPFRHIMTTNFDPVLEKAHEMEAIKCQWFLWDDKADLDEFLRCADRGDYDRRLIYLHGRFNRPESLVVSERDYTDRYQGDVSTLSSLWALAAMKPIVFLGFSLSDLDLMAVFRNIRSQVGGGDPRHFAIIGLHPEKQESGLRRYLRRKYGIDPVFYEILVHEDAAGLRSQDHSSLEILMQNLWVKTALISKFAEPLLEGCSIYNVLCRRRTDHDDIRNRYLRIAAQCAVLCAGAGNVRLEDVNDDDIIRFLQYTLCDDDSLFEALRLKGRMLTIQDKNYLAAKYAEAIVKSDDNPREIRSYAKALPGRLA